MPKLDGLFPEFRAKVEKLINLCSNEGLVVRVVSGLRTPLEQAILWRFGRSMDVIIDKIQQLKDINCSYLASCINMAGPQYGEWKTNALPGQSWHNWGLAVDFICFDSIGKPISDGEDPIYYQFQKLIPAAGLFNYGKNWPKDAGHVQGMLGSPNQYTIQETDKILSERYPL